MRVPTLAVLTVVALAGCASPAAEVGQASTAALDEATIEPLDSVTENRIVLVSWAVADGPEDLYGCSDAVGVGAHRDADDLASGGTGGPGAGGRTFRAREGAQRLLATLTSSDTAAKWNLCARDIAEPISVTGVAPLTLEVPLGPGDKPILEYGVEPDPGHPIVQTSVTVNITWWADAPAN